MTLAAEIIHARDLPNFRGVQLRWEDEAECRAGGYTSYEAIELSVHNSWESYAVYAGKELIALWGYNPTSILGGAANLWLLTTPAADNVPVQFARESHRIIHTRLGAFPTLYCYVHTEHDKALNWLKWLGFKLDSADEDFYTMVLRREQWAS